MCVMKVCVRETRVCTERCECVWKTDMNVSVVRETRVCVREICVREREGRLCVRARGVCEDERV